MYLIIQIPLRFWTALNPKSQWNYYTPIRAANYFLENGLNLEFSDLILNQDYEAQMKRYGRYQYEVRLLRAYYYFLLVRAYGDVPQTGNNKLCEKPPLRKNSVFSIINM